jgi:acid phosphatase (class A)
MEEAARADTEETVFRFLAGMGITPDPAALPATASLFARLHADESVLVGPVKRRWHRSRPFAASPVVRPCVTRPWSASYPSGHAAFAYAAAEALADILLEWQDAIRARAAIYARDRVVCGVHYPSDIEAGRLAGLAIAAAMRDDARYQAALAAARPELRHVLGLPLRQVSGATTRPMVNCAPGRCGRDRLQVLRDRRLSRLTRWPSDSCYSELGMVAIVRPAGSDPTRPTATSAPRPGPCRGGRRPGGCRAAG